MAPHSDVANAVSSAQYKKKAAINHRDEEHHSKGVKSKYCQAYVECVYEPYGVHIDDEMPPIFVEFLGI